MKRFWIKLFVEILDDNKLGPLPVWLKWRFVELLLVAAEGDGSGTLPPVTQLAWRLRVDEIDLLKSLRALCEIGVVCEQGDHWKVANFEKRQYSESYERVKRFKERERNAKRNAVGNGDETENESTSKSNSNSVSSEGGGVGEGEVFSAYESNIGMLSPKIADGLKADIDDYSAAWVMAAIDYAVRQEKRSLAYVEGVLKGWKRDGLTNPPPKNANGKHPPPARASTHADGTPVDVTDRNQELAKKLLQRSPHGNR